MPEITCVTHPTMGNPANVLARWPSQLSTQPSPFSDISLVIAKVTTRCNLRCYYCHESVRKPMDLELDAFKALAHDVLVQTDHVRVTFLFHGGEPSLLPLEWYRRATEYVKEVAASLGKQVRFAMQTNLVDLPRKRLDFFAMNDFHLGVSLDGNDETTNGVRGRTGEVLENMVAAKEAGVLDGVLAVIHERNWMQMAEYSDWLWRDLGIPSYKANVMHPVGLACGASLLPPTRVFDAQRSIIEYMIQTHGLASIEENLAQEIVQYCYPLAREHYEQERLCSGPMCKAGERLIAVAADGGILPCGRFTSDDGAWLLGCVDSKGVTLSPSTRWQVLGHLNGVVSECWAECQDCEATAICDHGCRAFLIRSRCLSDIECEPTKRRYQFYEKNRSKLLPLASCLKDRLSGRSQGLAYDGNWRDYSDFPDPIYHDSPARRIGALCPRRPVGP